MLVFLLSGEPYNEHGNEAEPVDNGGVELVVHRVTLLLNG